MTAPFEVDFSTLPIAHRYKLLAALVVPRPIALVTTVGEDGILNAAPFSFFNVFSEDPALVVLGIQSRPDGTPKDTLKHIRKTGAFVVNLVDEAIAERMNTCSIDFPSDVSEIEAAEFTAWRRRPGPAYSRGAGCPRVPPLCDPGSQPQAPALHR
jgi:flavin reductase (DIM6/NTAB) family NADH-FMN oxidoreductase RutF